MSEAPNADIEVVGRALDHGDWQALADFIGDRLVTRQSPREIARALLPLLVERERALAEDVWNAGYNSGFYDRDYMNTAESRDATEGRSENPYTPEGDAR